jgi:LacI family transcriptional regulator
MSISGVNGTGQRRPTMKEVAARAGVALKTVSRVVNEEPNVSPELTAKVQAAIKDLNYTPNESARMLRRGKTGTIAVVIRDIGDPFFASLGRAVELWARSSGSVVMIGLTDEDPERERDVCLEFVARRPDALIMAPIGETQEYLAPHVDAGMAVVTIDRPAHGIEADAVLADNAGGIDQAIDHLVRQGHRRIAYLGDDERIFTARERVVAYRSAMARHRIDVDEDLVHLSEPTTEGIGITLSAVLDRPEPATALLSANNMTTAEVLRGLAGRRDRVALVSFDDLALGDLLSPGLTAVAQSADVMARTAIQLMTERLPEPHRPGRTVRVPVKLTIRGSGEIPPRG